ncbi:hypothetical protein BANRA_00501 [Escherichia coli]|nr:hypothetical protein BANRA_00501 [Escherichia coli]
MLRRYMIMKKLNNILIDIHNMDSVGIEVIALYDKNKNGSLLQTLKKSIEKLVDIIKIFMS